MRRLGFAVAAMAMFGSSAVAAGIDSRTYTCADLHAMIAASGFVFIRPFGDFVVSNASFCGGGERMDLRGVPTADSPDCPVNYCGSRFDNAPN